MKFTYPGLTDEEVAASRAQYGSNAVARQEAETFMDKLLENLKDPIRGGPGNLDRLISDNLAPDWATGSGP